MPRITGDVRAADKVAVQHRALAEQATPHLQLRWKRDAPELADRRIVGNAVVLGQTLVDEGVVRGRAGARMLEILADDAREEQLELRVRMPKRRLSSKSGKMLTMGSLVFSDRTPSR